MAVFTSSTAPVESRRRQVAICSSETLQAANVSVQGRSHIIVSLVDGISS